LKYTGEKRGNHDLRRFRGGNQKLIEEVDHDKELKSVSKSPPKSKNGERKAKQTKILSKEENRSELHKMDELSENSTKKIIK